MKTLAGVALLVSGAAASSLRAEMAATLVTGGGKGYFRREGTQEYLSCDDNSCNWVTGWDKANEWEVPRYDSGSQGKIRELTKSGGSKCLDRVNCHWSESRIRIRNCKWDDDGETGADHCGSVHWQYNPSTKVLGEDWSKNRVVTMPHSSRVWVKHSGSRVELCDPYEEIRVDGEWRFIGEGEALTETFQLTDTKTFGLTRSKTITNERDFELKLFKKLTFTHKHTKSLETSLSSSFAHSASRSCSSTFPVGKRYRFYYILTDGCGVKYDVPTCNFASGTTPCCYPGFFKTKTSCEAGALNLC
jgi:hypothetical protein